MEYFSKPAYWQTYNIIIIAVYRFNELSEKSLYGISARFTERFSGADIGLYVSVGKLGYIDGSFFGEHNFSYVGYNAHSGIYIVLSARQSPRFGTLNQTWFMLAS